MNWLDRHWNVTKAIATIMALAIIGAYYLLIAVIFALIFGWVYTNVFDASIVCAYGGW